MSSIPCKKWCESLSAEPQGCCAILDKDKDERRFKNAAIVGEEVCGICDIYYNEFI